MSFNLDCDPNNIFFRCVEDSNEAIMITDTTGVLVYVNPAWEALYGYSRAEAVGQTPRLLHSGHQTEAVYEKMWTSIRDPQLNHWKGEIINRSKAGTLVPVLLTITPFKSAGSIIGYMGIAVDLTYKKELELKVVHQDRLASVGLLSGGLAHEVGTPLGVIRGRAEFLLMDNPSETAKKNLAVIINQIDRISKLIRSLLRVSRSSTDARLETFTVKSVLDEISTLMRPNFNELAVDFSVSCPENLTVYSDFGRLEQVLLNLVTNALHAIKKATKEDPSRNATLKIFAELRKTRVAIVVEDSGCGISAENLKKIFLPFFTTKEVGEGTGLGLAIVSQILREVSGEISAESTLGKGSRFTVIIPQKEVQTAPNQ